MHDMKNKFTSHYIRPKTVEMIQSHGLLSQRISKKMWQSLCLHTPPHVLVLVVRCQLRTYSPVEISLSIKSFVMQSKFMEFIILLYSRCIFCLPQLLRIRKPWLLIKHRLSLTKVVFVDTWFVSTPEQSYLSTIGRNACCSIVMADYIGQFDVVLLNYIYVIRFQKLRTTTPY